MLQRALLVFAFTAAAVAQKPNLLLIVADEMGYGDLSCYGSLQVRTPNLDCLAANGMRCTDGYVSSSVCAPSRAGLVGSGNSGVGHSGNFDTGIVTTVVIALPSSPSGSFFLQVHSNVPCGRQTTFILGS